MVSNTSKGLGVIALSAVVISSMVGGGAYDLPKNMAEIAGAGAIILAWLITGIGIYFIANTFRVLAVLKPDLKAGIYMYARDGFGPYAGFLIGWGYWLCQIFGNVGYAVITMDALNYFFPPYFEGGNNLYSIIGGSLLIWIFNFLVLQGVKQASVINVIGTIANFLALGIFIVVMLFVFNIDQFHFDFWGHLTTDGEKDLGSIPTQIKSTMLVTLWSFMGIEGAVVLSGKARSQTDVSAATLIGFIGCLLIYCMLSLLPLGFMTQAEIAAAPSPSSAEILEKAIGPIGSWIMNIGMLVAILVSWLAWTLIASAIPQAAAENGTFPKLFAKENAKGAPIVSLFITSSIMQLAMILVYFANDAWHTMLSISSVMVVPAYLASTAYLLKLCNDKKYPDSAPIRKGIAYFSSIVGVLFSIGLFYAAGWNYLMLATWFFVIGIPVYIWAKKQQSENKGQPLFTKKELVVTIIISSIAVLSLILSLSGVIQA